MPFRSEAQRRLMYAAAAHKGGVDGVSQKTAKAFVKDDVGGKLPEKVKQRTKRATAMYDKS